MEQDQGRKRKKGILPLILVIILAFLAGILGMRFYYQKSYGPYTSDYKISKQESDDGKSEKIKQEKVPYTVQVDFGDTLMEEAQKENKLQIMTRETTTPYTAKKEGLFSWPVFKQTKVMVFHGKGTYTVDLSQITSEDISVNNNTETITIRIPEPVCTVDYLPEETEFFDTSNGLLRFGEMQLTPEIQNEMEKKGKALLEEKFASDTESTALAEKYAAMAVKEDYQKVVNAAVKAAVSEANDDFAKPVIYTIEVVIDSSVDATSSAASN